jgi:hypothetical protein
MATMQVWTYRRVPIGIDLKEFDVEAVDGSIGTVDEAIATAGFNYIVVDTGPWIFGKKVLLPAGIIERIDAEDAKVFVNRTREQIKNAPEYRDDVGATDRYRQDIGAYYTARLAGETRRKSRPAPRQRAARQTAPKRSASARGRAQTRAGDGPTKDELYEQAKRLGIEGRSKMNKAQLKRAVERRSTSRTSRRRSGGSQRGKANPVEVQAFLEGVKYPTRKGDLLREAERQSASKTVRATLERLPNQRFEDPTDVSKAVSKAG